MSAMLTLQRCDGLSVSTLLPKPGTDQGSGDRVVEKAEPHPSPSDADRERVPSSFTIILHDPGRFEETQVESSRLDGCQQRLTLKLLDHKLRVVSSYRNTLARVRLPAPATRDRRSVTTAGVAMVLRSA